MSRRRARQSKYIEMYCGVPSEFIIAYPQPQILLSCYQRKSNRISRNSNALESNSLYRNRLAGKYPCDAKKIMCIESPDCEVEFYMKEDRPMTVRRRYDPTLQMADGDKRTISPVLNTFEKYHREGRRILRPTPRRPLISASKVGQHSLTSPSPISRSTFPFNRVSTWRKLQANITASHYDRIQQFQRERQQEHQRLSMAHPTMLAPTSKRIEVDCSASSTFTSNITSLSMASSESNMTERALRLIDANQRMLDGGDSSSRECKTYSIENQIVNHQRTHGNIDGLVANSSSVLSLHRSDDIEELTPVYDLLTPPPVPSIFLKNLLLSSFSPNMSTSSANVNPLVVHPPRQITELLIIDEPQVTESRFVLDSHPSKNVHSLPESIEELCLLIRTLLQYQLSGEKTDSVQAAITTQLAILLTYLASPNREKIAAETVTKQTTDRMTCTNEDGALPPLTVETQTDLELLKPAYQASSHTELRSTSVTLQLPGRRLHQSLSDTFLSRCQRVTPSDHRIYSLSETTLCPNRSSLATKKDYERLLQRIGRKFQRYVELESSNTCLGASTEFTPDFLVTTMNNSKHDNDDQTEQFGFDIDNHEDCNSEVTQDHEQYHLFASIHDHQSIGQLNFEKDDVSKSSIAETNSLSIESATPTLFDNDRLENQSFACHWQMPIVSGTSDDIDLLYEKRIAKLAFKPSKIRSHLRHGMRVVGRRVLVRSNPSSRASTPTQKSRSNQEQLKRSSAVNRNNNHHEGTHSTQSTRSTTSIDSSYADAFHTNATDQTIPSLTAYSTLDKHDYSSLTEVSSDLLLVTDKLDSNIVLAENLLDMLNSLDQNNSHSSTANTSLLHMYIRQFLIQFDARIYRERNRRRTSKMQYIHL